MSSGFQTVPVLDWKLVDSDEKAQFLLQLRDCLVNVGFLYLKNPPVDPILVKKIVGFAPKLFELPLEKKLSLRMSNSPHFLGYSCLGSELTKGTADHREQFDFGTPYECKWRPGDPEYLRLWGPPQWPAEEDLPGFKETLTSYLSQVELLSEQFTTLLAEALGLAPDALDAFFDYPKSSMQHRSKVVKYPPSSDTNQGVGPHTDSGFLTFLLQASPHRGLQAQNLEGKWIDVPALDNTLVINLGKGLETATHQTAIATTHRVLSPAPGEGSRYSIPFFQIIKQEIRLTDVPLQFPDEIKAMRDRRGSNGNPESVNYQEYGQELSGHVSLIGRIKSHPDVAERHYSQLFKKYFGNGMPQNVCV